MFERFSKEAKGAVLGGFSEAERLGHDHVNSMHLLLALTIGRDSTAAVIEESGITSELVEAALTTDDLGDDAEALGALGIDLDEVTRAVEASFGEGALSRGPVPRKKRAPMSSGARKALELSLREAIQLGDKRIGSEHILLGVLRNGTCSAHSWLIDQGYDPDAIRKTLLERLRGKRPA